MIAAGGAREVDGDALATAACAADDAAMADAEWSNDVKVRDAVDVVDAAAGTAGAGVGVGGARTAGCSVAVTAVPFPAAAAPADLFLVRGAFAAAAASSIVRIISS